MRNSKKTRKHLCKVFVINIKQTAMVKPKVAKIFKVVKKTVDSQDQLVVRYKNIDNKKVKELKRELNAFLDAWLAKIVSEE